MRWLVMLPLLALTACGGLDYFSSDEPEERIAGERMPVLALASSLRVDPAAAATVVGLPQPIANSDWPQDGGNPHHVMLHVALAQQPKQVWSEDIGSGVGVGQGFTASPVVADDKLFVLDGGTQVTALHAETGDRLWRASIQPEDENDTAVPGGLAVFAERVYVATGYAELLALAAADGQSIWRVKLSAPARSAPTVFEGRVIVTTLDNVTEAFDAATGMKVWRHEGLPQITTTLGGASPAAFGDMVVVAYRSGEIVGLRAAGGQAVWSDTLSTIGRFDPGGVIDAPVRPVMAGGGVFSGSAAGRVMVFEAATGRRGWSLPVGTVSPLWLAGSLLYFITPDNNLAAVIPADGRARWVTTLPLNDDDKPRQWYGPLLAGGVVWVIARDGVAQRYDALTGMLIDTMDLDIDVAAEPIVAGTTLYLLTRDGSVVAYR